MDSTTIALNMLLSSKAVTYKDWFGSPKFAQIMEKLGLVYVSCKDAADNVYPMIICIHTSKRQSHFLCKILESSQDKADLLLGEYTDGNICAEASLLTEFMASWRLTAGKNLVDSAEFATELRKALNSVRLEFLQKYTMQVSLPPMLTTDLPESSKLATTVTTTHGAPSPVAPPAGCPSCSSCSSSSSSAKASAGKCTLPATDFAAALEQLKAIGDLIAAKC